MKRKIVLLLVLAALALLLPAALADEMPVPRSYVHLATPAKGERSAPVYSQPKTSSDKLLTLQEGETLEVVGDNGNYYLVLAEGQIGYLPRAKARLYGEPSAQEFPERIDEALAFVDAIPFRKETHLELNGPIHAGDKVDTLYVYLWDERQFTVEQSYIIPLDKPADTIDAGKLKKALNLTKWMGGRKTLTIQGSLDGERVVLFRSPVYISGENSELKNVTALSTAPDSLKDTKLSTAWKQTQNRRTLTVDISPAAEAVLVTLEWNTLPDSVTIELYDANRQLISSETRANGYYNDWISLPEGVATVSLTPEGREVSLSTLRVYADDYSRHGVQRWQEGPEKLDMLLVATHQDDELLFLGGTLADYLDRGAKVNVLYSADCGRMRIREALDGLWTAGLRSYPIFLGLPDKYTMSPTQAEAQWAKYDLQTLLVRAFRRYKPEVIVTQDFNGEYGHGQHKVTVKMTAEGVTLAADPAFDPESAQQYGVWQVKKLYVHSYQENEIVMDWTRPLDDTGVITPLFLTTEAYDKHRTQQAYFSMQNSGRDYDNTRFGLYFTAVGPDEAKNDFLEHINWQ